MKTRTFLFALFTCSALLGPRRAHAQASDRQADFTQAQEAIGTRNWEVARKILLSLWAEKQTYDVALSLGQVELQLNRNADAANHLAFGLRSMPPRESEELGRRARELLDVAKQHVGSASIVVKQPNAELRVDAILIGKSPLDYEWFLEPGTHAIEARLPDGAVAEKTIDVRQGPAQNVELDLRPVTNAATEPSPLASAGGAGDSSKAEQSGSKLPLYLGGGAVLGIGAGIGFLIAANSKNSEKDAVIADIPGTNRCGSGTDYESECAHARSLAEDAQTFQTIGFVSLGVGVAAGVTALVLLALPGDDRSSKTQSPKFALAPILAPGNVGAAVTGEF